MDYQLIKNQSELTDAIKHLVLVNPLAVDMEMENNLHHYGLHLALVQIATPANAVYIFDPVQLPDLRPLGALLTAGRHELIIHGADFDRRTCFQLYGWILGRIFDTQIAAMFCGFKQTGLASLLDHLFGVKMEKRFQRHDWLKRPLSRPALEYAVRDVNMLHALRERLIAHLIELGRLEWVKEEFARAEKNLAMDTQVPPHCRIKHSALLSPRQLAVLKALFDFREAAARRFDMPPQFIIRDAILVDMARRPPADEKALRKFGKIHPRLYRKNGFEGLLRAVKIGAEAAEEVHPSRRARRFPHSSAGWEKRLREMRQWRLNIAREFDIEQHLVLDGEVMEWRARHPERHLPEYLEEKIRNWQRQIILPAFAKQFGA